MSKEILFDVEMKTTNLKSGDKIMMIDENQYIFIVLKVDFPKATLSYPGIYNERYSMDITDCEFTIID